MDDKFIYSFGINQEFGVKYGLNIKELSLLSYIGRAFQWADVKRIEGENYVKLYTQKIINDMPSLEITSKQTVRSYIASMVQKGVVVRKILNNNEPWFRVIEGYNFSRGEGANFQDPISIINNNINMLKSLLKEKDYILNSKGLNLAVKNLNFLLEGTKEKTDLGNISHMDLIEIWNGQEMDLWKKVNISNPNSKVIKSIQKQWNSVQRDYTKEEFKQGLCNYAEEIEGRNPDSDYAKHRFTLLEFITQKNGLDKFVQYE